jgi:hypothetical protein
MHKAMFAIFMLAAALVHPRQALAIEGEIPTMSCGLFLDYIGTDPSDFEVFQAWLQGYTVANRGATTPEQDHNLMSSLIEYCRTHRSDTFATASEFAVKKRSD